MSGLAAGIRLAYFEKSVCILERHTTIGGLNSFYRLRGRNHDVGLHAVTNFAEPGTTTGPLSKLLRQLRLSWEDFSLVPQNGSVISFPDHTLRFENDFEVLEQQIHETFPAQKEGFQQLLRLLREHDELNLNQDFCSAREVVGECLSDPILIDMLFCPLMFYGSATPHDMDFSQFVIMFKALYEQGFGRPAKGVRQILKQLVLKYKQSGGELRLRAGVREIVSEQGRATGVILDDGTEIEADHILSSAGSVETLQLCRDSSSSHPHWEPGEISYAETIFSLDCEPTDLGHDETIIFYNLADSFSLRSISNTGRFSQWNYLFPQQFSV